MTMTSRVIFAMGAVTMMTYGSALAQQPPAQPPQAPPTSVSPAVPPASPASPAQSAQTQTASGELLSIDPKDDTMTVKTTTGEIKIKYDNDTKVTGASRNTAGLATMSGSQVVVRYRKDGATNVATSIDVKPAAGAAPAISDPRPLPGGDRPTVPDPSKPPTPRP